MNRIKIGTRLGLAFGLSFVLASLIAAQGFWSLGVLKAVNQEIATTYSQKSRVAQLWASQININWVRAAAALKTNNLTYIEKLQQDMTKTSKSISENQKQLEAMVGEEQEKALLTAVASTRTQYVEARAVLLKQQKNGADVATAVDKDLYPLAEKYLNTVNQFATFSNEKLHTVEIQSVATASNSQKMLAIAAGISIFLGIFLSYLVTRSITKPLEKTVLSIETIRSGNLVAAIEVEGKDETSFLLHSLKEMRDSLAAIVTSVRQGSETVAIASAEISQGNHDLSTRTESQASSLEQTAASMEQLGAAVTQNAESAREANHLAQEASHIAVRNGDVVSKVVDTMKDINTSSQKIADIISVIDGIAFQTNILALNAAVEAARAGEQGRGFAVVASEVRSLAGRSANAAKEIKSLITASVERVEAGSILVNQAGTIMSEVVTSIRRVTDIMSAISAASTEQSVGVTQIGAAVTHMDEVTQQNAAMVEEIAAAADKLKSQSQELVQVVSVFKLADQHI